MIDLLLRLRAPPREAAEAALPGSALLPQLEEAEVVLPWEVLLD